MRVNSIETIGPHRAIRTGLAHVMHHDEVVMSAKEAGEGDRAATGIQFVISDLLTPPLLRFPQSVMRLNHFISSRENSSLPNRLSSCSSMKECAGYEWFKIVQNPENDRSL